METNRTPPSTSRRAISIRMPASLRPYSSLIASGSDFRLKASRAFCELIML